MEGDIFHNAMNCTWMDRNTNSLACKTIYAFHIVSFAWIFFFHFCKTILYYILLFYLISTFLLSTSIFFSISKNLLVNLGKMYQNKKKKKPIINKQLCTDSKSWCRHRETRAYHLLFYYIYFTGIRSLIKNNERLGELHPT